ncbi:MAG TPA: hypothetical protein VE912_08775 [Bacteroidales bacterium]|nr:hypothetical protein [Bacteroidales bacterium]
MKGNNRSNRNAYIKAAAIIIAAIIGAVGGRYSNNIITKAKSPNIPTKIEVKNDSLLSFTIDRNIILKEGDFIVLNDNYNNKIKISLNSIKKLKGLNGFDADSILFADINVDIGGGIVFGGKHAIMNSVNTYFVPKMKYGEQETNSIYYYYLKDKSFTFFQLFVQNINSFQHKVTLKVFLLNRDKISG